MGMMSTMIAIGSAADRLRFAARYDMEAADALKRLAFVAQAIIHMGPSTIEGVPGVDADEKIGFLISVPARKPVGDVDATICEFGDQLVGGFEV